jgi:hypothetical protein
MKRGACHNVLRALALFGRRLFDEPPINLVKLAWSYLQLLEENCYFDDLLRCLVKRNLVKESWDHYDSRSQQVSWNHRESSLHNLVWRYVSVKLDPVDMCNVLEMESQESLMGRKEILATFLPLKMTMAMNDFSHYLGQFYCEGWEYHSLFKLLDTEAENGILAFPQPHNVKPKDIQALLHLMNFDEE